MENIRLARLAKNLTGEQLGELVGVKKSAISKYERGDIQPSKDVLISMSQVLDVSTDYLLGNERKDNALEAIKKLATNNGDELSERKRNLIEAIKLMDDSDVEVISGAADVIIARRER